MNPTHELNTAERIAQDIDKLDELENALGRNEDARFKVVRLRRRRLAEAPPVACRWPAGSWTSRSP